MTTLYTADTHLFDGSKENKPYTVKVSFIERDDILWKDGEIEAMKNDLKKSGLLQTSQYGTFICHSDLGGGYSALFKFKPQDYVLRPPTFFRNIDLKTPESFSYGRAFPIDAEKEIIPSLKIVGSIIADFDQMLLREKGLETFKEKWYPETVFKVKR